jgi:hypothetical protein
MADERDRLGRNDDTDNDDVEAHRLGATIEPESNDEDSDDVEAHRLG